ncbi:MAG: demethylmenaquinone methyltransferase [Micropruina sp.]|nr:demethylmenaquinone methyltransferase [Micropruina sp.]
MTAAVSVGRGKLAAVVDTGRARATLAKRRADVAAMFDGVAARYDLVNDLLTGGLDRGWRRAVLAAVAPRPGEKILDLAAGTGTSSRPFADAGALVVAADLSLGMLQVGAERQPGLTFVNADALSLPFADAAFDAVTISFGLRNVEDTAAALTELRRVTRPGGRIVICEFSTPVFPPLRMLYQQVALRALPLIARLSASNPVAYDYLAESILAWPAQRPLADLLAQASWVDVQWKNLTGGIVALHRARA